MIHKRRFVKKLMPELRSVEKTDEMVILGKDFLSEGDEHSIKLVYEKQGNKWTVTFDGATTEMLPSRFKSSLYYCYPIEDFSGFDIIRPYLVTIIRTADGSLALTINKTDTYDKRKKQTSF